jgi:hypothetical protein
MTAALITSASDALVDSLPRFGHRVLVEDGDDLCLGSDQRQPSHGCLPPLERLVTLWRAGVPKIDSARFQPSSLPSREASNRLAQLVGESGLVR